jgi:hypothetical protein
VHLGWDAPSSGRYVVTVTQDGDVYRHLTLTRAFHVD